MRRWMLILMLVASAVLAACGGDAGAGGGAAATPTPFTLSATATPRVQGAPSNGASFGAVTLSGAQSGVFTVETVSAFALDGNLTLTLGLIGGKVLVFDLPLELMQPGRVELGDPDTAPAFASLTDASAATYLSTSGGITFSATSDEIFAAEFSF
ncbi:MAG: hypothetical protein KC519_12530, partial [Anaerolineae bacterium]|nr:hypothetical protein [Anaerolineae bacterium]